MSTASRARNPIAVAALTAMIAGCGGSSSSSPVPATSETVQIRFAEGAPVLESLVNGYPVGLGNAYLQVDGQTVSSAFSYGVMTQFVPFPAGAHSLTALDTLGYRVGPLTSPPLSGGKRYTLVLVGAFPNYSVLAFEEPAPAKRGAQLSLYEASPSVPKAAFGSFDAAHGSGFKVLGSAAYGNVVTVSLGSSVSNFGAYAGQGTHPFGNGTVTPVQIDGFDTKNALPFHNAARLSLFLFDRYGSTSGPVFGSLDK